MVGSASEGAAQVLPVLIPRMSEEANATVAAVHVTTVQIGAFPQEGVESELILPNKRTSAIMLVPIFSKRENVRDCHQQMAKFSVKMLIVSCISSSYNLVARASRCRARIFLCISGECPAESIDTPIATQSFETN